MEEKTGKGKQDFDIVVIGGGATGCGIALDAASRGLKTLLLEKDDFASGTSSKSTKLLHGGVRYLESALKRLDRTQYRLVRTSLIERHRLLRNAPHLSRSISLVTPIYRWSQLPYIFAGLTLYDKLAGRRNIKSSRLLSSKESLELFGALKPQGLKAGVLYHDGQFNDFRMNITVAKTAELFGAKTLNYCVAEAFVKEGGRIRAVVYRNRLTGATETVGCKTVINAAGPFVDEVRKLDDQHSRRLLELSAGTHIALKSGTIDARVGMLIPKTDDGRVLFVLPWEGAHIVGTTDEPVESPDAPAPRASHVEYLLSHINRYLSKKLDKDDIGSCWSGVRPLIRSADADSTSMLPREHMIEISPSGLVTIAGGKWTTFLRMARDAVDSALKHGNIVSKRDCITDRIVFFGSHNYSERFVRRFRSSHYLDDDILAHLVSSYGTAAVRILELAARKSLGDRILPGFPYIAAEVNYAARYEFVKTPADFVARRVALAQTDSKAAIRAVHVVGEILDDTLGWGSKVRRLMIENSLDEIKKQFEGWL